eukprot:scpid106551/ scgid1031/ 
MLIPVSQLLVCMCIPVSQLLVCMCIPVSQLLVCMCIPVSQLLPRCSKSTSKISARLNVDLPGLKHILAAIKCQPVLQLPVYDVHCHLAKQTFGHNKFSAKRDQAEN